MKPNTHIPLCPPIASATNAHSAHTSNPLASPSPSSPSAARPLLQSKPPCSSPKPNHEPTPEARPNAAMAAATTPADWRHSDVSPLRQRRANLQVYVDIPPSPPPRYPWQAHLASPSTSTAPCKPTSAASLSAWLPSPASSSSASPSASAASTAFTAPTASTASASWPAAPARPKPTNAQSASIATDAAKPKLQPQPRPRPKPQPKLAQIAVDACPAPASKGSAPSRSVLPPLPAARLGTPQFLPASTPVATPSNHKPSCGSFFATNLDAPKDGSSKQLYSTGIENGIGSVDGRRSRHHHAPIDYHDPFGTTRWNSHRRVARADETTCTWRLREKSIFHDAERCNIQFLTADLLARHVLIDHVAPTQHHHRHHNHSVDEEQQQLQSTTQAESNRFDADDEDDTDPLDLLPRNDAEARPFCRWGNCSNRRYRTEELARHVLQHLEVQLGLVYSCPFVKCPTTAPLGSESVLHLHLGIYHRDPYTEDDLRPIFAPIKVDRNALTPPPPLPASGSREDQRLLSPIGLMLGAEFAISSVVRSIHSKACVPPLLTETEWLCVRESCNALALPVQSNEETYCWPWPKLLPKLEYRAERARQRKAADEAIEQGFLPSRDRMGGHPLELVDLERLETLDVLQGVEEARLVTTADVDRVRDAFLGVHLPPTEGLRETLSNATLRCLAIAEDEAAVRVAQKPHVRHAATADGEAALAAAKNEDGLAPIDQCDELGAHFDLGLPGIGGRLVRSLRLHQVRPEATATVATAALPVKDEGIVFVDLAPRDDSIVSGGGGSLDPWEAESDGDEIDTPPLPLAPAASQGGGITTVLKATAKRLEPLDLNVKLHDAKRAKTAPPPPGSGSSVKICPLCELATSTMLKHMRKQHANAKVSHKKAAAMGLLACSCGQVVADATGLKKHQGIKRCQPAATVSARGIGKGVGRTPTRDKGAADVASRLECDGGETRKPPLHL
ncbi:hypothetical protein ACQY0O_007202 [Thecaphora frezii]